MRFIGWILLLVGFLLCVSIAWAALGFLLMGVGLITLQVGEQKRRRMKLALATAEALDVSADGAPPPRKPRRANWDRPPYDKARWQELVDSDPDLAQLASVLADYGPQYVDELATSYMAAPDKSRLGGIVDTIIARARGEALRSPPSSPPPPTFDPPPVISQRERAPDIAVPPPLKVEKPARLPPPVPPEAPPTDLEASLFAAVAEASAQANAARAEPPLTPPPPPSRLPFGRRERSDASEPRPERAPTPVLPSAPVDLEASLAAALGEGIKQPSRREPDFRAPARSTPAMTPPPAFTPPPLPDREPNELEASLIAAVAAASTKANAERAEAPQAVPPPLVAKRPMEAPKLAREVKLTPPPPPPPAPPAPPPAAAAPPPPPAPAPPPAAPIDDLDESLLAALADISGQPKTNRADPPKPPATPAAPPSAPKQAAASPPGADDDLSEMIKRFAPDSNFLSKK